MTPKGRKPAGPTLAALGAELAQVEARAVALREAMTPLLVAAYQRDARPVSEIAAEAGMKRGRVLVWLRGAGVTLDREAGNRFMSGRRPVEVAAS